MLAKGRTAIEGRSGREGGLGGLGSNGAALAVSRSSRTAPANRMPLRGSVLMRRCALPLSPTALRAALMRVVNADSETSRPPHTAARMSSLLTTRSRLRTK